MIKETNSNYAYLVEHSTNFSFNKMRELACEFIEILPNGLQDALFDKLNRGVALLDSEPLMNMYLYSYGKMHQAKLKLAFNNMGDDYQQMDDFAIVDYGCGQALASVVLYDHLKSQNLAHKVNKVVLIEPSETTLKRAALHACKAFPFATIKTINKEMDDVSVADITCENDFVFHLFSNILDVEGFSISKLANTFNTVQHNKYNIICASPYFSDLGRNGRIVSFFEKVHAESLYEQDLEKGEWRNDWSCAIRVFSNISESNEPAHIKRLRRDAERGNPEAQNRLGVYYDKEKNYSEAVKWFTKAAMLSYASAQNYLGYCYHNGQGVEKNIEEAVKWFTKAAEQGHTSAQYNLGYCYKHGQGVKTNLVEAVKWFTKAAEQGNASAQYNLGYCYYHGCGVEKDYNKAVKLFSNAAEKGNANAQFWLGVCYQGGKGVNNNYFKAIKWYTKAAEQGNTSAQHNIMLCFPPEQEAENNLTEAIKWLTKEAELGNVWAQIKLGACYQRGQGIERSFEKAIKWYTKAAEQGVAEAQYLLGRLYGYGDNRNDKESFKWFLRAAEQGHLHAQTSVYDCYNEGIGTEKNLEEAEKWKKKAGFIAHGRGIRGD